MVSSIIVHMEINMRNAETHIFLGMFSKFERFQSQKSRRTIALLYLGSLIALLVETWFVDSYLTVIPMFGLMAVATILLFGSTRGMASENSTLLDEQQIASRNAGYRHAYMMGITAALLGGYFISQISNDDTAFEVGLWLSVFGFVSTLPTVILAWTLPSEIADED